MLFRLNKCDDQYQEILSRADETEYDVYMKSLCNQNTTWLESGGENM